MRIGTPLALLFLALALLLSACGDDEGGGGDVTDAERSAEKAPKSLATTDEPLVWAGE
jgi:hypothetical protein